MAQLVLSAAGAGIGFLIGGPTGAQIGWAAGSLVGASMGPNVQGPRLADTKVQISSYGAALPVVYGGVRIAGNVIWSTDLIETASESGGKGGPGVTTYSYSASCAVALCEGPIGGIRRIWADAKLVYDISEDADAATQAASGDFARYLTVYLGTESQLPDATIEAVEGAGNVEAYRGTAYAVFTALPLGDYGNRVPSFSFEVTSEPEEVAEAEVLTPLIVSPWTSSLEQRDGPTVYDGIEILTTPSSSVGGSYSTLADALAALGSEWTEVMGYATSDNPIPNVFDGGASTDTDPEYVYISVARYPATAQVLYGQPTTMDPSLPVEVPPYDDLGTPYWVRNGFETPAYFSQGLMRITESTSTAASPATYDYLLSHLTSYAAVHPYVPETGGFFPSGVISATARIRARRTPYIPAQACEVGDPGVLGIAQIPGNDLYCISNVGAITQNVQYAEETGAFNDFVQLQEITFTDGALTANGLGPMLRNYDPDTNNAAFWTAAAAAAGVSGTYGVDYPVVAGTAGVGTVTPTAAAAGTATLASIVTDICERAGLGSAQIDVTALDDIVDGFKITRQMPARAALEPLRQAYYFDAVENGREIVFVKRGAASVATFTADDLGATEGAEPAALVVPRRAQETELPAEVNVAYECRAADYQTGAQQARRVTTGSQQVVGVELPIVLTDAKAAEVADVLMIDAWQGRTERRFSTGRQFTRLLPTDVVTVNDGEFSYRGRITDKVENGPVIAWTLRDEAAATYSPNASGSTTSGGGGSIRYDGPMRLELMDVPLLRDADDNAGFYVAQSGYRGTARGGTLYKSTDDTDYAELLSMDVGATLGNMAGTLGAWDGGNMVDEANTVNVTLNSGTLASVTREQLLANANSAVIGNELVNFQRAVLVSGSTYTLSGFLRGRVGTERHMATHTATDRFVLLTQATVYRVSQPPSQVGSAYYKGVAYGTAVADASTQLFENTAEGLLPLSPVHLNVAPIPGGGYAASWVRRSRYDADWLDYVDAPLAETTESYCVQVLNGATVVETQTVSTNAATLASADYTGYTLQVQQMSETIGPGHAATATIP